MVTSNQLSDQADSISYSSEPQRSDLLLWSTARFIAHSRLPQASAFIPAIGYAILWSEQFGQFLKSRSELGSGWLPLEAKLHLLWWGAVFMTAGWLLYLWKCPNEIKRSGSTDDYVKEKFLVPSVNSVADAQERAKIQIAKFHPDDAKPLVLGGVSPQEITRSLNYLRVNLGNAFHVSYTLYTIKFFELEYRILDHQDPRNRKLCNVLLGGGAFLFLIPSFEVALRVFKRLVLSIL